MGENGYWWQLTISALRSENLLGEIRNCRLENTIYNTLGRAKQCVAAVWKKKRWYQGSLGQLLGRISIWTALWRYETGSVGTKEWGEHGSRRHWREQKLGSQTTQISLGQEQHWPDVKLGCNGVFGWKGRNNDWFLCFNYPRRKGSKTPLPG